MNKHTPGPWRVHGSTVYMLNSERDPAFKTPITHHFFASVAGLGAAQDELEANAVLMSAAPELLAAQTMGSQMNTPDFLDWIADRLVHVYGASPNVDFVHSLRDRAKAGREAIAKATGESNG